MNRIQIGLMPSFITRDGNVSDHRADLRHRPLAKEIVSSMNGHTNMKTKRTLRNSYRTARLSQHLLVKKTLITVAILLSTIWLQVYAQETRPQGELVSEKAHVLITLRLSDLLQDRELMDLFKMDETVTTLTNGFRGFGLNPDDITNVVMFCDMSVAYLMGDSASTFFGASSDQGYFGVLVYTNYDVSSILDSLNNDSKHVSYYNGHHIWCEPQSDECFAFIDDEAVMVGTLESVKDVIDVKARQKYGFFNGAHGIDISKMARHINQNDALSLMVIYPEDVQTLGIAAKEGMKLAAKLVGFGILGDLFDLVGTVKGFSVSMSGQESKVSLSSAFLMEDNTTATLLAGSINITKELAVPFVEDQKKLDPSTKKILQVMKDMSAFADDNVFVLKGIFDMRSFLNEIK